jgi:hypothetical protein
MEGGLQPAWGFSPADCDTGFRGRLLPFARSFYEMLRNLSHRHYPLPHPDRPRSVSADGSGYNTYGGLGTL